MKTKNYKADWILKNCNKEGDKNHTEVKNFDIKLGRNTTKWQLKVIFNQETDSLEVYLVKKKVRNDNFHISFLIKIGRDEFQWDKKAMEIENAAWGWPAIMRLDVLFDDSKGYIDSSKRMKLGIDMSLTELDEISTQLESSQGQICNTCSYYFDHPDYNDCALICDDGVSLPIHHVFLAKKSPVFKKHFDTQDLEQNKIALKDISSETMKEVLRFALPLMFFFLFTACEAAPETLISQFTEDIPSPTIPSSNSTCAPCASCAPCTCSSEGTWSSAANFADLVFDFLDFLLTIGSAIVGWRMIRRANDN